MEVLESRRALLEDLEIIEDAIASRFCRNPALYYSYLEKRAAISQETLDKPSISAMQANRVYKSKRMKRSRKQLVLQQHEINLFLREAFQKLRKLGSLEGPLDMGGLLDEKSDFEAFINKLGEVDGERRNSEDSTLEVNEKISQYAMFSASSSKEHPTTIKSERAFDLQLNDLFTRDEQYGEYMDLERFHSEWFKVIQSTECTLLKFLDILSVFLDDEKYLLKPPMDRKNERYLQFLGKLSNYVETYFCKCNILLDNKLLDSTIKTDFLSHLDTPIKRANKGYYSIASGKWFKTQAVYESYLTGKNHKKSVTKRYNGLLSEYKIHRYLKLLQKEFNRTREFIERKLAFTTEERIEEMAKLNECYDSPDYGADEKEEENSADTKNDLALQSKNGSESSVDLPLGPDGLPMPYWLYKLQGLDVTYTCEICGNLTFKGRRAFEKHFTEPTHMLRLRCLGIEPSPIFKGITSIEAALKLSNQVGALKKTKTSGRHQQGIDMDIEMEDEDGNVMSKKLYEELKKQGLV
ncbi:hypothetical protein HG535_0C02770 [Zygotorulaspora mrakii]|uniref:Matrin-type domain-containing protein n=1 Tax=Zygotorulaspora mrakii TaxID=42260 RepID=A0A7H9AZQ2_ZYGMR|nr:uncharacterized protein HG535_0C02770 [Zygotorulaspora mrakii]QLG71925.1 hypothetical protein HG535_0C02770 [Zygotorulaspora mrakii]